MKNILILIVIGLITSCEKDSLLEIHDYEFKMVGRTYQDPNGYYHLPLDPEPLKQTLHRFGAHVTNKDKWDLPTQVIWRCDTFWALRDTLGYTYIEIGNVPTGASPWSWENFAVTGFEGMPVPIVNSTSFADPSIDSVFCMMAPIGDMIGDTITIYGRAYFEEGLINIEDSLQIILN